MDEMAMTFDLPENCRVNATNEKMVSVSAKTTRLEKHISG